MSDSSDNKQRLLIVDDSKVIRVTARKILQNHFETVEAVDGNNAWDILTQEAPFSLVISDLTMPGMDGFELLEKVRSSHLPRINSLPVIIITGANDSETTKQRATDAGATDFIGKPFDAVHLLARTQAHADAYNREQSLAQETMTLEEQAQTDPVSGLPNESAFIERGQQLLSYAARHRLELALFCIDIDNFGDLYTQHGETATAAAVSAVAEILSTTIRQEDTAARIGSSRFALLLPGMDTNGIRNLAGRILQIVNAQFIDIDGSQLRFTVSIGIAAPEINTRTDLGTMISYASGRLQEASSQGGNTFVLSPPPAPASTPDIPDGEPGAGEETSGASDTVTPDDDIDVPAPAAITAPLPDLEVVGTGNDAAGIPRPADDRSPQIYEAGPEEETIVITAPGDYFAPDETPESIQPGTRTTDTAPPAAEEHPTETRVRESADETAAHGSDIHEADRGLAADVTAAMEEVENHRPGFLSRLWSFLTRNH